MRKISSWLYDNKFIPVVAWLIIFVSLFGISRIVGDSYKFDVDISTAESVVAFEKLSEADSNMFSGESITFVVKTLDEDSTVLSENTRKDIESVLAETLESSYVKEIVSPYDNPLAQISQDKKIAYANIVFTKESFEIPSQEIKNIVNTANALDENTYAFGYAGQAITQANPPGATFAEGVGLAAAAVILFLAFGSVLAASLPLGAALIALGSSLSVVVLASKIFAIPSFAPQLVTLIGIGVGIDYALFVVSRHRAGLLQGKPVRESVIDAFDTSGRAVVFAGLAVMIALLGLLFARIGFLDGLAIGASIGVLFTMLVTITLLPALFNFLGLRVLGRKERIFVANGGVKDDEMSTRWGQWSRTIQKKPGFFIAISLIILLVMSIPSFSMRLGTPDQGSDPQGSTTRTAYDLLSEGFGEGANGTILLVVESPNTGGTQNNRISYLAELVSEVDKSEAVANVSPFIPVGETSSSIFFSSITPSYAPQDERTTDFIETLREEIVPKYEEKLDSKIYVSGAAAIFYDFADVLSERLPWFLLGVIGISSLLLLIAFRSIAVPVKAAFMNILAAGASFGVLTAVFQWGWGLEFLGVDKTGPIDAFLPVLLLAILFGLSLDYQVFLVSRIKEEWEMKKNNTEAVVLGLAETGKVITAAALIMISVFTAFMFGGERIIKMFGLGLAVAIFVDAFIVRSLLVPALMQVLGKWNWWIPKWLDRILPNVTIEPTHVKELKD
jgi:RND superfamily putative drug exporter